MLELPLSHIHIFILRDIIIFTLLLRLSLLLFIGHYWYVIAAAIIHIPHCHCHTLLLLPSPLYATYFQMLRHYAIDFRFHHFIDARRWRYIAADTSPLHVAYYTYAYATLILHAIIVIHYAIGHCLRHAIIVATITLPLSHFHYAGWILVIWLLRHAAIIVAIINTLSTITAHFWHCHYLLMITLLIYWLTLLLACRCQHIAIRWQSEQKRAADAMAR